MDAKNRTEKEGSQSHCMSGVLDRVKAGYMLSVKKVAHTVWLRRSLTGAVLVVVFAGGVLVGNGQVQLHFLPTARSENPDLPAQLNFSSVNEVYDTLKANYDGKLTQAQLLDGLKEGLAQATNDPYTEYFNSSDAKQFANQLNNSFSGIGAVLGKDADGSVIIVSPIRGFPAEKAGLQPQDIITSVNGESTAGLTPDVVANKIRGPKGTAVTLKVIRNKTDTLTYTITRDDIQVPSVTTKTLDGNIGYMQISTFADDTSRLATQAAQAFQKQHVKGVILDLRNNPGGLRDAAVDVSGLWLPTGTTVLTEKGTSGDQTFNADGNDPLHGIPTVVLINEGSASASEITAAALHDNNAARLIGVKSYGKGVVQSLIPFSDGSELKVTIASWYRPNGQNINKQGITPDQTVTLSDSDSKAGNDTQLAAAQAYLGH